MLNTKSNIFVQELVDELNRLRADPKSYIPALEDKLNCMEGGKLKTSVGEKRFFKNGESQIMSAIEFLEKASPSDQKLSTHEKLFNIDSTNANKTIDGVDYYTCIVLDLTSLIGDIDRPNELIVDMLIKGNCKKLLTPEFTSVGITILGDHLYLCLSSDLECGINREDHSLAYTEIVDCRTGLTEKVKKYAKPILKDQAKQKLSGGKHHKDGKKMSTKDKLIHKAKEVVTGGPSSHTAGPGYQDPSVAQTAQHATYGKQNTLLNDKKHRVKLVKY